MNLIFCRIIFIPNIIFLIYLSNSEKRKVIFSLFYSQTTGRFKIFSTSATMKIFIVALVCFTFLIGENRAFDIDNYTAYIEELMHDEKFLDEYARWSFQLFSQPDYLYGDLNKTFPCAITKDSNVPTSVHTLRPSDVKCVGAIGDSLTAGLGAHAITPVGLFFEHRGLTFVYDILLFTRMIFFRFRFILVSWWRSNI